MSRGNGRSRIKVTVREQFLGDKETARRGIRLWANLLLRHAHLQLRTDQERTETGGRV